MQMKFLMNSLSHFVQDIREEERKRGSYFIFDSIQLLHYKCCKVNFKRGVSYIDSPDWIKKKKATVNPKNADDKSFNMR